MEKTSVAQTQTADLSGLKECNQASKEMGENEIRALYLQAPPGPWPHRKDTNGVDVHADCFPPGTLVRMADGSRKPIEQIGAGDSVLTAEGRVGTVRQLHRRYHNDDMLTVLAWGHRHLRLTANHPVLTQRGYVLAGELRDGDWIAVPRYAPETVCSVRTADHVQGLRLRCPGGCQRTGLPARPTKRRLPEEIALTPAAGRIIGLWLAEGHTAKGEVSWSFALDELDTLAAEVVRLLREEWDCRAVIRTPAGRGVATVHLSGTLWAQLFRSFGGRLAAGKRLYPDLCGGPRAFLEALFWGWMDGDGHTRGRRKAYRSGATVSRDLAGVMYDIASFLGLAPSINREWPQTNRHAKTRQPVWKIHVNVNPSGYRRDYRSRTDDGYTWRRVRGVRREPYTGTVYNLGVEGDNSYVAEGIGVHNCWAHWDVTKRVMRGLLAEAVDALPSYPDHYQGQGIVIGGGGRYIPSAWVAVRKLRHLGCQLPIQVWYLGEQEMDPRVAGLFAEYGADVVDARRAEKVIPARILCGWELKGYATAFCPFREVLYLDADCAPVRDPTEMFEWPEYRQRGAVFFPDFDHGNFMGRMSRELCADLGITWRDEPSLESGQFLINKERCWREMMLTWWILEHSDYYFVHFYGDKESFHVAWRFLGSEYAIPARGPGWDCNHCIVQHDFAGNRLFLHRCQDKWRLDGTNRRCDALEDEGLHFSFVRELAERWDGRLWHNPSPAGAAAAARARVAGGRFHYRRLTTGSFTGDERELELLPDGRIGDGAAECERRWEVNATPAGVVLSLCRDDRPTCHLNEGDDRVWRGSWLTHERCAVELEPIGPPPDPVSAVLAETSCLLRSRGYTVDNADLRRALGPLLESR